VRDKFSDHQDIDPIEIGSKVLPHIVLIDVETGEPIRDRYGLVGSYVEDIFGANYAGQYLDELALGSTLETVSSLYAAVGDKGHIAILDGAFISRTQTAFGVSRIAMPLAVGSNPIGALFCACEKQETS
jgi:hypothetical protein